MVYHDVGRRTYVQEKEESLVEGPTVVITKVENPLYAKLSQSMDESGEDGTINAS